MILSISLLQKDSCQHSSLDINKGSYKSVERYSDWLSDRVYNATYLKGLSRGLNEIIHLQHLTQHLTHGKRPADGGSYSAFIAVFLLFASEPCAFRKVLSLKWAVFKMGKSNQATSKLFLIFKFQYMLAELCYSFLSFFFPANFFKIAHNHVGAGSKTIVKIR